jgi:hypothetical protein
MFWFVYRMPRNGSKVLRWLKLQTGVTSQNEVIDTALTLLQWAIEQVRNGRQIGSFDPSRKTYRAISMVELDNVKPAEAVSMAAKEHAVAAHR